MNKSNSQVHLNIRFKTKEGKRDEFRLRLFSMLEIVSQEEAFVSATISDDLDQPDDLLLYEVWEGTRDSWKEEQPTRQYRKDYEATLSEMILDRSVSWLEPKGQWNKKVN